jgi:hypothetical protein
VTTKKSKTAQCSAESRTGQVCLLSTRWHSFRDCLGGEISIPHTLPQIENLGSNKRLETGVDVMLIISTTGQGEAVLRGRAIRQERKINAESSLECLFMRGL